MDETETKKKGKDIKKIENEPCLPYMLNDEIPALAHVLDKDLSVEEFVNKFNPDESTNSRNGSALEGEFRKGLQVVGKNQRVDFDKITIDKKSKGKIINFSS